MGFTYYSTEQGLGSSNVHKIKIDKYGFAWIGTQDGLYRFDGHRFVSYNKTEEKKHHIPGSDIKDFIFQQDTLWLITSYGGLTGIDIITGDVVFELDQQNFHNLSNVLFNSLVFYNNNLYIASDKGFFYFNITNRSLKKIEISLPGFKPAPPIQKIALKDNNIWLFCPFTGIVVWNPDKNNIIDTFRINISNYYDYSFTKNEIITATGTGIHKFRLFDKKIHEIPFSENIPSILKQGIIYSVATDSYGHMWLSSNQYVYKIDSSEKNYDLIKPGKTPGLKDWTTSVFGIFFDNKNNIWLSTQEGIALAQQENTAFICYQKSHSGNSIIRHTYSLFPYSDTAIYVCAEDGLYDVNLNSFNISPIDVGKAYFFAFRNSDNTLIVSNENNTYAKVNNILIPIQKYYPELSKFDPLILNSFVRLNDTCLVLGSQNEKGVFIWNPGKHTVLNITANSGNCKLPDNDINTLYKLNDSACLVLAANSVSLLNPATSYCREIVIENTADNKKYLLFFDIIKANGLYFLSSYGNGILVLDTRFKLIKTLTTKDGLANNGVYKIFNFKDSLLFATTNNGLSEINLKKWSIKNYYSRDGIHSNVFEELSGSMRNQTIYAGGADGFTAIYLDRLKADLSAPTIYFTNIIMDQGNKNTDTSNIKIGTLNISNKTKQTSVYFSSLNFSNPDNINYYYRIREIQNDWLTNNNQNYITLVGLKPGTYHLEIKAVNQEGIPSDIKELTLIFLPKWYQTWWFKALIAVCIIAIGYSLYRMRINQLKKEEKIRNQLASDLHDDLGSTLNSIKVFSNLAMMEKENLKYLLKVKEGTQDAIAGVRDLIWVLDDKKDTIQDLLARINQFAAPLCEANHIKFEQKIDDTLYYHKMAKEEKRNLYMILKESINNSIKYAGCETIELKVAAEGKKLQFTIGDDGKGFEKEKIKEGNGLKNITSRAKKIGYTCSIISATGTGTIIVLGKS